MINGQSLPSQTKGWFKHILSNQQVQEAKMMSADVAVWRCISYDCAMKISYDCFWPIHVRIILSVLQYLFVSRRLSVRQQSHHQSRVTSSSALSTCNITSLKYFARHQFYSSALMSGGGDAAPVDEEYRCKNASRGQWTLSSLHLNSTPITCLRSTHLFLNREFCFRTKRVKER